MPRLIELIESIEAGIDDDPDFELECRELVYKAVDKNFKKFVRELKTNRLALDFAEALAISSKGLEEGYFPSSIADSLPFLELRLAKRVYSFLKNIKFANSNKELFTKAYQAAVALHEIGDKYFPGKQLMDIAGGDEKFVWNECFSEFWRYLLAGLIPDKEKKLM